MTRRCLDWCVTSPGLPVSDRVQVEGIADHDLVYYDVEAAAPPPGKTCPARIPVMQDATAAEVAEAWAAAPGMDDFYVQLRAGNTQEAWDRLCTTAEAALTGNIPGGRCRGRVLVPKHRTEHPAHNLFFE